MSLNAKRFVLALALSLSVPSLPAAQFSDGALVDSSAHEETLSFDGGQRLTQRRASVQVPAEYGRLVAVTPGAGGAVLWFEATDGAVRNVRLSADQPLIVRRRGQMSR